MAFLVIFCVKGDQERRYDAGAFVGCSIWRPNFCYAKNPGIIEMTNKIVELDSTEFENLIFDLTQSLGLKNAVWRTPGRDVGRDIQGEWYMEDLSGHVGSQLWYVECKRHESSVGWPSVWEKISFAESNAADVLLFTVSSSLSPQAVDEVNKWNNQRKRPVIRFWNGSDIEKKLRLFPLIAIKFGLSSDPRVAIGRALLPAVNILLKFSIAAHSAEVFEIESSNKRAVLYSMAELISARLSEVEEYGVFSRDFFREATDGFEWLKNGDILEKMKFDRYAIRVIACYLKDLGKSEILSVHQEGRVVFFDFSDDVSDGVFDDLCQISLLSNFEIYRENKRLLVKVR